jgi:alkaline phosphatase
MLLGLRPLALLAAVSALVGSAALDYQRRNPDTLVVVLGDHETGGLSLLPGEVSGVTAAWASEDHSVELVPLFAGGPGAEAFGGVHTGAEIGQALRALVAHAAENGD